MAVVAVVAVLAGCGGDGRKPDVPAFVEQGRTPAEREVLRSIATYRTTEDEARACSLVTPRFLRDRFEGEVDNCEQVQRQASRHLPEEARVDTVAGDLARVRVNEPTATASVYEMRRVGRTWRVDAILQATRD